MSYNKTVPKKKKKKRRHPLILQLSTFRYGRELVRCELQGSKRKTSPKRKQLKRLICNEGWDCLKVAKTKLLWIAFYGFMCQIYRYL